MIAIGLAAEVDISCVVGVVARGGARIVFAECCRASVAGFSDELVAVSGARDELAAEGLTGVAVVVVGVTATDASLVEEGGRKQETTDPIN